MEVIGTRTRLSSGVWHPPYGILESWQEIGQGGVLRHRQSKEAATERQSTYTTAPVGYSTTPPFASKVRFDDVKMEGFSLSPDQRMRPLLTAFAASGVEGARAWPGLEHRT